VSHSPNSDDDYQIEVAPAPHVPPRRPRTPNPQVDEAIQSGEIELPRSLIIRSSQSPPIREDRTERTEPAPVVTVAKRHRFGRLAWLVAAIAPAIAAIILRYSQPAVTPPVVAQHSAEAESFAQLVGTSLDAAVHTAKLRAEALASSSMLRAGIQTDAATLADMAKDQDVVFGLSAGERVEVFQTGAHAAVSMLRVPTGAAAIPDITVANVERLDVEGGKVVVVVTAPITPPGGAPAGLIALAAPVDLAKPQFAQLSGVALTGFASPIALGGGVASPTGTKITAPITTALKGTTLAITATLAAAPVVAPDHLLAYARYACAALATLFLLMYLASVIIRR
jgi:hypothetical protein